MADNPLKDVLRVLNAYISEYGDETVSVEFPKAFGDKFAQTIIKAKEDKKFPDKVAVVYIDSKESINVKSTLGAQYIKKVEYGEGLTGETK